MPDYTVIVDDSVGQIVYEPGGASWSPVGNSTHAYQGTLHNAMSQDANLAFNFVGGRELIIRGNFNGDNDASESATYPIFQVDTQSFNCLPNPPQNGGQFLCFTVLLPEISNHTLSMFVNPNAANQHFHIDYIRHGSSSQAAQAANGTVLNVQSPDKSTPGLSFDGQWKNSKSLGSANDVKSAMLTSTLASKATYNFMGDSFAWWSCCMPPGTSNNAANVTYSIDGGDAVSLQIGGDFMQSAHCKDEKILFQTQKGQLQAGNHTVEVVYNGDDTKMPLTLCALAAVPLDFSVLDSQPSGSNPNSYSGRPTHNPTPTSTITTSPAAASLREPAGSNTDSVYRDKTENTGIIVGVIAGIVFAFLSLFIVVYLLRRKRARDVESRISFNAPRLAVRRVVPSVDLAAHDPPTRRTSVDKESILEAPPPFYRSSMAKSRFSWRSLSFRAHPHQQTAYVGSDYGTSVLSFNPRDSTQSYYHNYQQSEPPRYYRGSKSHDPDPILPLP